MKKISLILLIGGAVLTIGLWLVWALGFVFAGEAFGSLIHLLLVFSVFTAFCAFLGFVLFIVSLIQKK